MAGWECNAGISVVQCCYFVRSHAVEFVHFFSMIEVVRLET